LVTALWELVVVKYVAVSWKNHRLHKERLQERKESVYHAPNADASLSISIDNKH